MVVIFEVIPIGAGSSISDSVAEAVKLVAASGLDYRLTAMGTIVEGDGDQVVDLVRACHRKVMEKADRVITHIMIDDRKGYTARIEGKVKSVEQKIGHPVKK
jgi:uncharacterized protein (TIGR00106 family)